MTPSSRSGIRFALPGDGWVQIPGGGKLGTYLRSGDVELTAVEAEDGTWVITEGTTCA